MKNTEPWLEQLARSFNLLNKLKPSALDEPEVRGATRYELINPEADLYRSRATMLYKGTEGNYRGSCLTKFETVNIELLFKNNSVPTVVGYNPKSTREVAKLLVAQYGLSLHADWFIDEPFDATILPTHVTLRTVKTAFCSESKLTVRVERSVSNIEDLIQFDTLDAPTLPFDPVFCSAPLVTYSKDFTPFWYEQRDWFSGTPANAVAYKGTVEKSSDPMGRQSLCKYLADVIGSDANVNLEDTAGNASRNQINLALFYVRYNGTTRNAVFKNISADITYDMVMIIEPQFGKELTNFDGPLFIHYNNA